MKNRVKKIVLLIIAVSMCLNACSFDLGGDEMFDSRFIDYTDVANAGLDEVLISIKNKDSDELKSLFAKNAIVDLENFDDDIIKLLDYFKGDFVTYDDHDAINWEQDIHYGEIKTILFSTYDIVTTEETYRVAIKDICEDDFNEENIGIWSIYIIRLEDDIDSEFAYRGDDKYTPGINFDIKNTLPEVVY